MAAIGRMAEVTRGKIVVNRGVACHWSDGCQKVGYCLDNDAERQVGTIHEGAEVFQIAGQQVGGKAGIRSLKDGPVLERQAGETRSGGRRDNNLNEAAQFRQSMRPTGRVSWPRLETMTVSRMILLLQAELLAD